MDKILPVVLVGGMLLKCSDPYLQSAAPTAVDPTLVVDGGDLDIEVRFTATVRNVFEPDGRLFFDATSTDGEMSLRYTTAGDQFFTLRVRGVDVLTNQSVVQSYNTELAWEPGDEVRARAWYRPSTGSCGLRIAVNGVYAWDQTTATTGGALAPPTGTVSISGDQFIARTKADVPVAQQPEFVFLGDSTVAAFGQLISIAHEFYAPSERWTRPGIGLIAVAGDTAQLQKAKWDVGGAGHVFTSSANLKAVIIQIGVNNILQNDNETTTTTAIQALVNDIHTTVPTAKIVIGEMTPSKGWFDTHSITWGYAEWLALNADIMGTGTIPITGVDARVNAHEIALNDGTGALQSAYNFDGLHENNAGRDVVAPAYRAAISALGLI